MLKTAQQLNTEIDSSITENGTGAITGLVLNAMLKSMTGSLAGSYFSFPKDNALVEDDIGKLMMDDGSGTAKVYQYCSATTEQLGRWVIKISSLGDLADTSMITIEWLDGIESINRVTWRNGNTPTTIAGEMGLIKDYIESVTVLSFLTATVNVDNELILEENDFQGTRLTLDGFTDESYTDIISRPALPAAPTAFPLGKLLAIDGSSAIISSNPLETYTLSGTSTIDHSFFDLNTPFNFATPLEAFETFTNMVIIPAPDGKARHLDINDFATDVTFTRSLRHQFIGIASTSTSTTISVMTINQLSLILNFIVKMVTRDISGGF